MDSGSADLRRSLGGSRGARSGSLRFFERALWAAGTIGLGWCALVIFASRVDQIIAGRELDRAISRRTSVSVLPAPSPSAAVDVPANIDRIPAEPAGPPPPRKTHSTHALALPAPAPAPRGSVVARIQIERIGLSVVAREGDDTRTLRLSVGHIPGTSVPPGPGNAAFAGHRDRQFRDLGRLRVNDPIRLTTEAGEFVYRVEWTAVVDPNASWVLDPTPDPTLTLVTCFPFGYVGNAPDRFVVRARRQEN